MKKVILSCLTVMFVLLMQTKTVEAAPPGSGWTQVFGDEFNDYTVDTNKWRVSDNLDYDKNGNKCWFYPSNVKEDGNSLVIENHWYANPGANGEVYSGGWITSKKEFNKGYFEARIRLDWADQHFWPTFWMWKWQPTSPNEFDIMEYTHWHTHPSQSHHYPNKTGKTSQASNTPVSEWHVWGLLWTDTEVSFYIDGVKQFSSERPDVAQTDWLPMIFSCSPNRDNQPARTGKYPRLFVDWVRVWQGGSAPPVTTAPIGKTIALIAQGPNKYISASQSLDSANWPVVANKSSVGNAEKFKVVDAGNGYIALQNVANGKYVCSDEHLDATNWRLYANRSTIGDWEKFTWHPVSGGVALRAKGNGKYICSDRYLNATNWPLAANRNTIGAWEKFSWEIK